MEAIHMYILRLTNRNSTNKPVQLRLAARKSRPREAEERNHQRREETLEYPDFSVIRANSEIHLCNRNRRESLG